MDIEWTDLSGDSRDGMYVYGDWCLTVIFAGPDSYERSYFLTGPDLFQEISTTGGCYTALDIAAYVIYEKSLTS